MLVAVAGALEPPDLPVGVLRRQRVEHGQHRSGADAGADQQNGRLRLVEDEGAARCSDLELVADGKPVVQVAAGGAVGLVLDGDAVVVGAGWAGEGVVAEHRAFVCRRAGCAG